MTTSQQPNAMRSLSRAIDVLEALENEPKGLQLSEVATKVGLSPTTTLRILAVLEERGRIERDGRIYRAGVGLLFGAHAYLQSSPLVSHARPILQDLAMDTGLTASLFVLHAGFRVVVSRVQGEDPLRYELPIGERLPLHLGAGKVLAAALALGEQQQLAAAVCPFRTMDGKTVDGKTFLATLSTVAEEGFVAISENERVRNGRSVACAVQSTAGVIGALQLAGTTTSLPEGKTAQLVELLSGAAKRLGRLA